MTKPFTVTELRCLELARIIRGGLEGVRFEMGKWRCGAAGCIAGHYCAVYAPWPWRLHPWRLTRKRTKLGMIARNGLGLTNNQAARLFLPWQYGGPKAKNITPAMAAATLENYALTGKVQWRT